MAIDLQNVTFSYHNETERKVIDIHQWSIANGEQVFVHGPSGGGKSTLLGLLSGMLSPSAGKIRVLGERLDKMSSLRRDRFRANHIGYVFQDFNLVTYLDAIDNIKLARHFSKQKNKRSLINEIKDLLQSLNIAAKDWYKPTALLSNGQQQRVAIARALINKPEIVIADEPTSSLDHNNRDKFMSKLLSLVEEHRFTLLFVSHDLTLSRHFSRADALNDINRAGL